MLYLLLGPDDFFKKSYINALVKEKGADLVVYHPDDEMSPASRLTETDLFSRLKVFVFDGPMPELGDKLEAVIASKNSIIVSVESLDKRKKENKDLLNSAERKELDTLNGIMELLEVQELRVAEMVVTLRDY